MSKQITLNDIYQVVNRLEDKMDERLKLVENRVDTLEDFKGKSLGIMSAIMFVVSGIFTWIWERLTKSV